MTKVVIRILVWNLELLKVVLSEISRKFLQIVQDDAKICGVT